MIRLKSIIQDVLNESAFDDAFVKWKVDADESTIEQYIDLFKILKTRGLLKGSEADISPWIKRPFEEFKQFIDRKEEQFKQVVAIKRTKKDADKVFENDQVLIISPNTWEASCKYGASTKWCISMGNVKRHWVNYASKGIKFYFILPKHGKEKYAVAVYPNGTAKEAYNELDQKLDNDEFKEVLLRYNIPGEELFKNEMDWRKWLKNHNHRIREDGRVDIEGDVNLAGFGLTRLPFRFGNVSGYFDCSYNKLTSLRGNPKTVGREFACNGNSVKFSENQVRAVCDVGGNVKV